MDNFLNVQAISKSFSQAKVCDAISFNVKKGDLVTLLGPSGCGKTTLLRCIAGLSEPDSGQVILDGLDITSTPIKNRNIGMVFQSYALFPTMTVKENIAFGLKLLKLSKEELETRIFDILELVRLKNKTNSYPHQLSGGQKQRVALARALVLRPKLLFLDEPLSALDAQIRKDLRIQLKEIQTALGITSIFVTHDQEEALVMSDKIIVLNQGVIEQEDTPENLYMNPKTKFMAKFIGNYNIINAKVAKKILNKKLGDSVMAIRPEAIKIVPIDAEITNPENFEILEGKITFSLVHGNIIKYKIKVAGTNTAITVDMLNQNTENHNLNKAKVKLLIKKTEIKIVS